MAGDNPNNTRRSAAPNGLAYALGAHAIWGSMPIYLLLVKDVPVFEYVAWRTLFTLPLCLVILYFRGQMGELRVVIANRRALRTLLLSAAMIAINWCLYVWAIQTGKVYAASLGYYILPLAMMLLGLVFLGEKLSKPQWAAVGLATIGVTALSAGALTTMWVSLSMAVTFGIYGLLRKTVSAGPLTGLAVEALWLTPIAIIALIYFANSPQGLSLGRDNLESAAIIMGGPMTAAPLILFATAARKMPYTVIGFLQFTSPTIVFLMGLFFFGEELKPAQLACFVAIWAAASIFTWSLFKGDNAGTGDKAVSRGAGR